MKEIERLVTRLETTLSRHGLSDRYEVALLALCLACVDSDLDEQGTAKNLALWKNHSGNDLLQQAVPILIASVPSKHIANAFEHLMSERKNVSLSKALQECMVLCLGADIKAMSEEEDLLGLAYTLLRSSGSIRSHQAYFTPLNLSRLVARLIEPTYGSVYDPAIGTGTMFIAAAEVMREKGQDPSDVSWYGQDIDGMALALSVVNAAYRRISGYQTPQQRSDRFQAGTLVTAMQMFDSTFAMIDLAMSSDGVREIARHMLNELEFPDREIPSTILTAREKLNKAA